MAQKGSIAFIPAKNARQDAIIISLSKADSVLAISDKNCFFCRNRKKEDLVGLFKNKQEAILQRIMRLQKIPQRNTGPYLRTASVMVQGRSADLEIGFLKT